MCLMRRIMTEILLELRFRDKKPAYYARVKVLALIRRLRFKEVYDFLRLRRMLLGKIR